MRRLLLFLVLFPFSLAFPADLKTSTVRLTSAEQKGDTLAVEFEGSWENSGVRSLVLENLSKASPANQTRIENLKKLVGRRVRFSTDPSAWRILGQTLSLDLASANFDVAPNDRFGLSIVGHTRTDKLNFTRSYHINFSDPGDSTTSIFHQEFYEIHGVAQPSFTYQNTNLGLHQLQDRHPVPRARVEKLMADLRALPLDKLPPPPPQGYGSLDLDGREYRFAPESDDPLYRQVVALFTSFLDEVMPRNQRKIDTHTVEGDFVPATAVSFADLFHDPKKYDGKRIRLTGFYAIGFERSGLGPGDNPKVLLSSHDVWLEGSSAFFSHLDKAQYSGSTITVEGTYHAGPGGHLGGSEGELQRLTSIKKVSP